MITARRLLAFLFAYVQNKHQVLSARNYDLNISMDTNLFPNFSFNYIICMSKSYDETNHD